MFLNYRRSQYIYIALSILTLGLYSAYFRNEVLSDLNKACKAKKLEPLGAKFVLLNILTFGVYATLWDLKFLKLCEDYITENDGEGVVDYENYRFLGCIPFVRFVAMRDFIDQINLVCRIYSDKELEEVDNSELALNRVRDVNVDDIYIPTKSKRVVSIDFTDLLVPEKPIEEESQQDTVKKDTRMIAGHAVVEEYDPSKDQRRIGYKIRFEREARAEEQLEKETKEEAPPKEEEKTEQTVIEVIKCRRGKLWFAKVACIMALAFIAPIALVATTIFALPSVYNETYYGALSDKYDRLNEASKKPRIIVIGGSSVALGINSELIENELYNYEVVNFGLHSELGMKAMLDLSRNGLRHGDIVVLAPELTEKSMSLYFNGDAVFKALDGRLGMFMQIDLADYPSLVGSSFDFAAEKIGYLISGTSPLSGRNAYQKKNFNEYGDNLYSRQYNETYGCYDGISFDFIARMKDDKVTEYERYIEYVNDYTYYAERKGATVYYSFAPINEAAIDGGYDEESVSKFYKNLCSVLHCKVISDINSYILDEGYFYDNEFNLNDSGIDLRTVMLIDDIKRELGNTSNTAEGEPMQSPSGHLGARVTLETQDDIMYAQDFIYEPYKVGELTYYSVCGVSESGRERAILTLPNTYNGVPVVAISPDAFKEAGNVTTLNLSQNIAVISAAAFNGSSITSVNVADSIKPENIVIPISDGALTEGASPAITFYVEKESVDEYRNDVGFWAKYSRIIEEKS